ncbi:hypothetical protein ASG56_15295 [Rhodococcus sp. Leaf7]|nr:hypothetical protein ASG56_15295 [Rhodococcus sp. Leaf7]KQU37836.1 hypothetical protein ASG64_18025 [Rhodococcus sp. Leaf247]
MSPRGAGYRRRLATDALHAARDRDRDRDRENLAPTVAEFTDLAQTYPAHGPALFELANALDADGQQAPPSGITDKHSTSGSPAAGFVGASCSLRAS